MGFDKYSICTDIDKLLRYAKERERKSLLPYAEIPLPPRVSAK